MKLMHLGDLHLGKSLNEFNLIEDQRFILDRLLSIAEQEAVDGVMICGDVYDRAVPGEAAVALLDAFLTKLKEAGKTVFMISGNHDS
ncbi:MAG: exonuclease subunit SbcD, partial [Firmicutes bacterium]|nr:exonuclease subunit SbcD [Bacillota bacterium]